MYLKGEIPEDMLGVQISKFGNKKEFPNLRRGNYVIVKAVENQRSFTDHIEDDLSFKIVPSEKMMLCLFDSLGNIIEDAVVKCGRTKLEFDKKTKTYNAKSVKNEQILEVSNKGVYHYIKIT